MIIEVKAAQAHLSKQKLGRDAIIRVGELGAVNWQTLHKCFGVLKQTKVQSVHMESCLAPNAGTTLKISWIGSGASRGGHYHLTTASNEAHDAFWNPIALDEGEIMATKDKVATVHSLAPKLEKKKQEVEVASKLKCVDCGHVVDPDSEDNDWEVGANTPGTGRGQKRIILEDTGRNICPKCQSFQPHTIGDDFAEYKAIGVTSGIHVHIPDFQLDDWYEACSNLPDGARFGIGSLIENAILTELIKAKPHFAAWMRPYDCQEILEELGLGGGV